MKASELIFELQKKMEFMKCDPYVVIQHPDDDEFNNRDVLNGKRGLHCGAIGMEPTIFLEHANTLFGKEMPQQIWRKFNEPAVATWIYKPGEIAISDNIVVKHEGIICSYCGTYFAADKSKMYEYKYCPHCGCDMNLEE